jgi:hypothetical protein
MYSSGKPWALPVAIRRNRYLSSRSKSAEWLTRPSRRAARLVATELTRPPLDPVSAKIVLPTRTPAEGPLSASVATPRLRSPRRAVEDVTNDLRALKTIISKYYNSITFPIPAGSIPFFFLFRLKIPSRSIRLVMREKILW